MKRIGIVSFILSILTAFVKNECIYINASSPTFSEKMHKSIPLSEGRMHRLFCCMYGITSIEWTFERKNNPNIWQKIVATEGVYRLHDSNRILTIVDPKLRLDTGNYKCEGRNGSGEPLIGISYAEVFEWNTNENFKILNWSNTNSHVFQPMSNHTLFCVIFIYLSYNPSFMWNRIIDGRYLPLIEGGTLHDDRTSGILIKGYTGYSNISTMTYDDDSSVYNFTLTLFSLDITYDGLYSCDIHASEEHNSLNFTIYLQKSGKQPIYYLIIFISFFFLNIFLIYLFLYDIKIFLKNMARCLIYKNTSYKNYNIFFLYNFDDDNEFRLILKVLTYIEALGYSTYFHHRDQTYGKDVIEDIANNIGKSDIVVIWSSTSLFDSSLFNFCIHTLITNFEKIRKIYVLHNHKRKLIEHCTNKVIISDLKSYFSCNLFYFDYFNVSSKSKYNILMKWKKHQFISWLVSSLPITRKCEK